MLTQYRKDKGVGEVSIQREFHQVASDAKGSGGLNQRHEDPPADGSIQNSKRDTGNQLLFTRVRFWLQMIQKNKYLLNIHLTPYNYNVSMHRATGKLTSCEDDSAAWFDPSENSFLIGEFISKSFTRLQKPVAILLETLMTLLDYRYSKQPSSLIKPSTTGIH